MSPELQPNSQPTEAQQRAQARLDEWKRALQRQLKRKPNVYEKASLHRAALLSLRAEVAVHDPNCSANDVVRLDNAARRARADFEKVCRIPPPEPLEQAPMTLGEVLARHG